VKYVTTEVKQKIRVAKICAFVVWRYYYLEKKKLEVDGAGLLDFDRLMTIR